MRTKIAIGMGMSKSITSTPQNQEPEDRAKSQAQAWLTDIFGKINAVNAFNAEENSEESEKIESELLEMPLCVEMRSGWVSSKDAMKPEEFQILLSTGGPACRIIGEIDEYGQACNPRIQYQDWGTLWTDFMASSEEEEALEQFCNLFYFGE